MASLPMIDVRALVDGAGDVTAVATALDAACREHGFFYVVGHGVDEGLQDRVEAQARALFELPEAAKARVAMARGGRAWRGWFPLEGELTSGSPDRKEGFYLGAELPREDPRVLAGTPLHGPNLYPDELPDLRPAVLAYLDAMTHLGQAVLRGMALGLGLDAAWFHDHLTYDPTVLLRFFRYPPLHDTTEGVWGVGEHTDYGLLTILRQDRTPGLQVHAASGWVDAPPIPGSFVCNLGDMLERMTGGGYRSTPHRVRNTTGEDRVSIPFFLDPAWDARVPQLPLAPSDGTPVERPRWDGADVMAFEGTYGDHLLAKVARVFPELGADVLAEGGPTAG